MDNKKAIIGAILGIALIGLLIWFLFFRKKSDGKAIINVLPAKEPNKPSQPQKQIVYVGGGGGGSSTATFPLRQGSRGNEVKLLQEALNKAGYDVGTADGVWGNKTQTAFQKAFPNKLGINDLADLEKAIATLSKGSSGQSSNSNTASSSNNNAVKYWSGFAGKQATVKFYYTAVGDINGKYLTHYDKGDKIVLTGNWKYNKDGKVEVEFYRHNDRGKAWVLQERIEIS